MSGSRVNSATSKERRLSLTDGKLPIANGNGKSGARGVPERSGIGTEFGAGTKNTGRDSGVRFGRKKVRRGSDYEGAAKAFRAAQQLDPEDHEITGNLAVLLEHNQEGERYGTGAKLDEALVEYES